MLGMVGAFPAMEACDIGARLWRSGTGLGARTHTAVAARGAGVTRRDGDCEKDCSSFFVLMQGLVLEFRELCPGIFAALNSAERWIVLQRRIFEATRLHQPCTHDGV
jgi:hypothetical protein